MTVGGIAFFAVLAIGIVAVYSYLFYSELRSIYHDGRSRSESAVDLGYFICAWAIGLSIVFALFDAGSIACFGIGTLFMGAFLATGMVAVTERRRRRRR